MIRIVISIAMVICLFIIINSCTLNNAGSVTTTQQGAFLFAQASPDAPHLNIIINSITFDTSLQYKTYSPYIKANPGTYTFSVIPSDSASLGNTLDTVTTSIVTILANKNYSFFYIDSFSAIKTAFVNDVFQAPSTDSVYIRFFNFCPNLTKSINLVDSTDKNVILSSGRVFNDQAYNPQYVAFKELPAKTYILNLETVSDSLLKTQTITLTGGKVYTLIAKGINGIADSTKALSIGLLENYPQRSATYTF